MAAFGPDPLKNNLRFEKLQSLGTGAHGFVQLAKNKETGELVAIKFIHRGWDKKHTKYVLRELLNHQELSYGNHPHIVEFKEVFLTERYLAIVMEYVHGENLQTYLAKMGGKLMESLARFIFQQLVIALDFCHRKGKVNRDIKLANTLLQLHPGPLPLVKLCDFGFSKDKYRNSNCQSQVGTALFVAPEVMHNFDNRIYDGQAADVWACGVILFVMLFGRHPFLRSDDTNKPQHDQIVRLFERVMHSDYSISPEEQTSVSKGCLDLLSHILVASPEQRWNLQQIQSHEWFVESLPSGAGMMNETFFASEPAHVPGQAPQDIENMVKAAETVQVSSLRHGFTQRQTAVSTNSPHASTGSTAQTGGAVGPAPVLQPNPLPPGRFMNGGNQQHPSQAMLPGNLSPALNVNAQYNPQQRSMHNGAGVLPGPMHPHLGVSGVGTTSAVQPVMDGYADASSPANGASGFHSHPVPGYNATPMDASMPLDNVSQLSASGVENLNGAIGNVGSFDSSNPPLELSLLEGSYWHKVCQDIKMNVGQ